MTTKVKRIKYKYLSKLEYKITNIFLRHLKIFYFTLTYFSASRDYFVFFSVFFHPFYYPPM